MMETILDVGLSDDSVLGLAKATGCEQFAQDSYRRLLQMYGRTVLDIDPALFDRRGTTSDPAKLVEDFKRMIRDATGEEFPQDPGEQLHRAIQAVFRSRNSERARLYRRREHIPDDLGTAVNIQVMVFGNLGPDSGTGVAFTRDPATGTRGVYGDYLPNAQGEDVVAGTRNAVPLAELNRCDPSSYRQLSNHMNTLEHHFRDLCDVEFTIERGTLWMLQTRVGKRTAEAAFRIAEALVDENLIGADEALARVSGTQLAQLTFPGFAAHMTTKPLVHGVPASPGAAVGAIVFDSAEAVRRAATGEKVILVRRETTPDDLPGMVAAEAVLTSRGGKTSHAAVVARGMGKVCVCGAEELTVGVETRTLTAPDRTVLAEGTVISVDGTAGMVHLAALPLTASPVSHFLDTREHDGALTAVVDRTLEHADTVRRLGVRANADSPEDAARARRYGAEGIGLCRTEHIFVGERRILVEAMILAEDEAGRRTALDALLPLQRADLVGILAAMDGLPVTIRLIDPPLHEFLPDRTELAVRVATRPTAHDRRLLAAVERIHESNPMLGLRGVRPKTGLFRDWSRCRCGRSPRPSWNAGGPGEIPGPRSWFRSWGRSKNSGSCGRRRSEYSPRCRTPPGTRRLPHRHDDRTTPCRPARGADRRSRRLLLLRHQRPNADDVGTVPRRRRGILLPCVSRPGDHRHLAFRDPRPGRRRPSGPDRRRRGPCDQPRPEDRRMRRTRWGPGLHPLLPRHRHRLRLLLAVPRPVGPPRSGASGTQEPGRRQDSRHLDSIDQGEGTT